MEVARPAHPIVPELLIVPPVMGKVVAIDVTVPEPPAVAHEGTPLEVSCRTCVPELLPARFTQFEPL